jgi:nucleoside-diphosphate-sugar epimerase
MLEADVVAAAEGVSLVMHGANPPGYRNWAGLQLPMLNASIAAARAADARLIFPGTVYNFGPDAFPDLTESSPQNPRTRKGAIRVQMEQALAGASEDALRVLIVRAGDFFGPKPGNNWLSQGLLKPGRPISAVSYPGPLAVPHAWAYLPDVAETMVRLVEDEAGLGAFEVFHMRGQTLTGAALVQALEAVAGRKLSVSRLPWFAIRAMAAFNETMREMLEMRYLWEAPVLLDNRRLVARLGAEPHTPIEEALRIALAGLDALPHDRAALAA